MSNRATRAVLVEHRLDIHFRAGSRHRKLEWISRVTSCTQVTHGFLRRDKRTDGLRAMISGVYQEAVSIAMRVCKVVGLVRGRENRFEPIGRIAHCPGYRQG